MSRPLDGVRVLDLTRLLPGGFCTMLLADLGADVLKIEEPGKGDYVRWMPPFMGDVSAGLLALNRNKRSMTLNLKVPAALDVFKKLVAAADVVVESFRPGVMDRLGAGYAELNKINPRLVYCAITGYGQDGPYKSKAGHDVNYLGYAGVLSIVGASEGPPVIPGVQIGDLGGGALMGAIGILAALHERATTGLGRFVDTSMTDGAMSWLSFHAQGYLFDGVVPERGGMRLAGAVACYQIYPCADGKHVTVGALEPQFWATLCGALGVPEFIPLHLDESAQPGMIARITEIFLTKSRDEWIAALGGLDACVGPVNDVAEALDDPQARHRGMVTRVPVGDGDAPTVANPIRLRGDETEYRGAPSLGQHTEEVLAASGYSPDEIEALRTSGAI